MIEKKAMMAIASMISVTLVMQENRNVMQSRTIDVIFCGNSKFFFML